MPDAILNVRAEGVPINSHPGKAGELMVWASGQFIIVRINYGDGADGFGRATAWFGKAEARKVAAALLDFAERSEITENLEPSDA